MCRPLCVSYCTDGTVRLDRIRGELETDRQGRQVDGFDIGGMFQMPILFSTKRRARRREGGGYPKSVGSS